MDCKFVNQLTKAKLLQLSNTTHCCNHNLPNLVHTSGQILTHPRRPNNSKVKYAYMCNLTSQAEHASPIWESTQKTLSPKSKARLHRYVPTLIVPQISLFFSPFSSSLQFPSCRNHVLSTSLLPETIYLNCCHVIFSLLCIVFLSILITKPWSKSHITQWHCRICRLSLVMSYSIYFLTTLLSHTSSLFSLY